MDKVIKRGIIIKEKKKSSLLKIMVVIAIGLIVIVSFIAYTSSRDSGFIDEEGVMLVEPTYETEVPDKCMEHCNSFGSADYDWEGKFCRCLNKISDGECKGYCVSKEADGFSFDTSDNYCKCWFKMENPNITNTFDSIFQLFYTIAITGIIIIIIIMLFF